MALQKVREFTGLAKVAPETIEKNEMEQALRAAQFKLDRMLHDLHRDGRALPGDGRL